MRKESSTQVTTVAVSFNGQGGLESWHRTCLSRTAVKRPSNPPAGPVSHLRRL
jgi:hypothetical protein